MMAALRSMTGRATAGLRQAAASLALAVLLLAVLGERVHAEKRVALVIGNDLYQSVPVLNKAVTDANAVGSALRRLGFAVTVAENQSRSAFSRSLLEFDGAIEAGDTVLFYFAGHGFEIRGINYLLPVDVPPALDGQEELIRDASFAVDRIVDRLQARGARTVILVLDACRNNPFARPGTRAVGGSGGLAPVTPPEGVFVLFSAGAKQTALDALSRDDPDPDSVFTRHFIRQIAVPGLTLVQIAKRTQLLVKQVASSVSHEQTPAYYDEIVGDFVLNGRQADAPPEAQVAAALPPLPSPPQMQPPLTPALSRLPQPPPNAPPPPVNAPIAQFMRHNGGWSVSLSFVDPVTAISWRLGESGPFKETGLLDTFDSRTRRRLANPSFQLDADTRPTTIYVRAVDTAGQTVGPFPIAFDPAAELERGQRRILELTAGSWVEFRNFNGLLLYYTQIVTSRCAVRALRLGIDTAVPNQTIDLPPCDPARPYEVPSEARTYMNLPLSTKLVSVELAYRDGSVSETKVFRRPER